MNTGLNRDPRITIADCETLARWLDAFIQKIEVWGVRVSDMGRLRRGSQLFRKVAQAGRFPEDPESRHAIANGARAAMDFRRIQAVLSEKNDPVIASDLERAIKGSLGGLEKERSPFQLQSQLYVGALFATAGNDCLVPPSSIETPDFLVREGSLTHGIEVKRPSSLRGVREGVKKAARQLAVSGRGAVSMDLTDVITTSNADMPSHPSPAEPWLQIEADFDRIGRAVRSTIFGRRQYNPGFSSVLMSHCFARGWHWPDTNSSSVGPSFYSIDEVTVFFSAPGNLWHHRALWMGSQVFTGLARFGHLFASAKGFAGSDGRSGPS